MKKLAVIVFVFIALAPQAQTIEQIKADRDNYIWGEGTGNTISKADQDALQQIITQISAQVESRFTLLKDEVLMSGKANFTEEAKLMMTTYSNATLSNTERIVISNEPDTRVFRYIRRSELNRIFEQRKHKILDFTASADEFARQGQIADALKYYYWALALLRSHPDGSTLEYSGGSASRLLLSYLPQRINDILNGLRYAVGQVKDEPNYRLVTLFINYNSKPVANLEYSYWDGRDWSQPVLAKDGVGALEFFGPTAPQRNDTQIRVEYICEAEARIDRELEDVMRRLEHVPYNNSYTSLRLDASASMPDPPKPTSSLAASGSHFSLVDDPKPYAEKINRAVSAVQSKKPETVRSLFTPEGFDTYTRLLA